MTANHGLHLQNDVDRLYMHRKVGGRGLLQVRQEVKEEKWALKEYVSSSSERMLRDVSRAERNC